MVTIDGGNIILYGKSELMGTINSFDEISWKDGDFWLREGKATHYLKFTTYRKMISDTTHSHQTLFFKFRWKSAFCFQYWLSYDNYKITVLKLCKISYN